MRSCRRHRGVTPIRRRHCPVDSNGLRISASRHGGGCGFEALIRQRKVRDDGVGHGDWQGGPVEPGSVHDLSLERVIASALISTRCTMVPRQPSTMPTPLRVPPDVEVVMNCIGPLWLSTRSQARATEAGIGGHSAGARTYQSYGMELGKLDKIHGLTDAAGNSLRLSQTHRLRHTRATELLNDGVPIHVVQRYLGHASPEMTLRYAATLAATAEAELLRHKKIGAHGADITISPSDIFDMTQLSQRTDRVLPNGVCLLPALRTCDKGVPVVRTLRDRCHPPRRTARPTHQDINADRPAPVAVPAAHRT